MLTGQTQFSSQIGQQIMTTLIMNNKNSKRNGTIDVVVMAQNFERLREKTKNAKHHLPRPAVIGLGGCLQVSADLFSRALKNYSTVEFINWTWWISPLYFFADHIHHKFGNACFPCFGGGIPFGLVTWPTICPNSTILSPSTSLSINHTSRMLHCYNLKYIPSTN